MDGGSVTGIVVTPQEMALGLGELCESPVGRRVVLYLLSPRNRRHFSSQFLRNVLEPGDGNKHT